jgi:hypothetical protein
MQSVLPASSRNSIAPGDVDEDLHGPVAHDLEGAARPGRLDDHVAGARDPIERRDAKLPLMV